MLTAPPPGAACSPALVIQRAAPLVLFDTKGLPDAKDRPTRTLLHNLLRGPPPPPFSLPSHAPKGLRACGGSC